MSKPNFKNMFKHILIFGFWFMLYHIVIQNLPSTPTNDGVRHKPNLGVGHF